MYKETSIISNARLSTNHENNVLFWWKFKSICILGHITQNRWMHGMRVSSSNYYFCGITYWCAMDNAASNPDQCAIQCNNMMNDLTMSCFCLFCPVCTSVCILSIYL